MSEPLPQAWLDDQLLPLAEARISPLDRGFLFADGVYEVIPVYGGRPLAMRRHLDRLENSLSAIRLANPHAEARWRELVATVIDANGGGDMAVYLQVTRGAESGRQHNFPSAPSPTVFLFAFELPEPLPPEQGVRAVLAEDLRWARCDIKSIALLPNVMARQEAAEAGAHEAILTRGDLVTEGAATTVFCVVDDTLITPAPGPQRLPSVTRDLILSLAERQGIPTRIEEISVERLMTADEIWLVSSTRGIAPVVAIDGRDVGDGDVGNLYTRMRSWYDDALQEPIDDE